MVVYPPRSKHSIIPPHKSPQAIPHNRPSQRKQRLPSTKLISPPRPPLPIHLHNPTDNPLTTRLITTSELLLLLLLLWRRRPRRARVPRVDVVALSREMRVVPAALLLVSRLLLLLRLRLDRIPLGPIQRALFIRRRLVGLELLLLVLKLGTGIVRRGRAAGEG